MNQINIAENIIIISQMLVSLILIKKRAKISIENVGLEIGTDISNIMFTDIRNDKDTSVSEDICIFFYIQCGECKLILDKLEKEKNKEFRLITSGNKNEIRNFIDKYKYTLDIFYIDRETMSREMNLKIFPLFMVISNGCIVKKGYINTNLIDTFNKEK